MKLFKDVICETMKYYYSLKIRSTGKFDVFMLVCEFNWFQRCCIWLSNTSKHSWSIGDFTILFFFKGGCGFLRLNPWFSIFVTKSNNELDILFPDHPPEVEQTEWKDRVSSSYVLPVRLYSLWLFIGYFSIT